MNFLNRSNSGTCSPKEQGDISSGVVRRSGAAAGFQSLRDAVWNRVAQTILMQVNFINFFFSYLFIYYYYLFAI